MQAHRAASCCVAATACRGLTALLLQGALLPRLLQRHAVSQLLLVPALSSSALPLLLHLRTLLLLQR
jgi:hypothetical protein